MVFKLKNSKHGDVINNDRRHINNNPTQSNSVSATLHYNCILKHTKLLNTTMANFPFLPVAVLLFISLPLKQLTSKQPNQIYVNKINSCVAKKSKMSFRSFYWSLFYQSRWSLFSFSSTASLYKCLTSSFSLYF